MSRNEARSRSFLVLSLALATTACDEQPTELDPAFLWQESVTDMQDALLGSCISDQGIYVVGGRAQSGAVYSWRSRRWARLSLPSRPARPTRRVCSSTSKIEKR